MNNAVISIVIAAVATFFIVVTEKKKEDRASVGVRSFVSVFFVSFVALTYLVGGGMEGGAQDIEVGEPNF